MKKNYLLLLALGLTCSPAMAQENKGEVISLLPDGVTLNIGSERKMDKQKNLVVVGSPKKGYKAFFAAALLKALFTLMLFSLRQLVELLFFKTFILRRYTALAVLIAPFAFPRSRVRAQRMA